LSTTISASSSKAISKSRAGTAAWEGRSAVAELQAILGGNASLVDPNLAAAQDAIDMALRHAFGDAHQEVVDALALGVLADLKPCNRIFA
jgi:hypothetical protein